MDEGKRPRFQFYPDSISRPVTPPMPTVTVHHPPPPTQEKLMEKAMEKMVDDLVGPDTTPKEIAFTFLGFPPLAPDPAKPPKSAVEDGPDTPPVSPGNHSTPQDVLASPEAMNKLEQTINRSTMKYHMAHGSTKYT